jgi:hypothetical protein
MTGTSRRKSSSGSSRKSRGGNDDRARNMPSSEAASASSRSAPMQAPSPPSSSARRPTQPGASPTQVSRARRESRSPSRARAGQPPDDSTQQSRPASTVWVGQDTLNPKLDHTTVMMVVTDELFKRVKFVDAETDLGYSLNPKSICGFMIEKCNVAKQHLDVEVWWQQARKGVRDTVSRLRNDKTTSLKWEFLGE